jgi:hypothetical protein
MHRSAMGKSVDMTALRQKHKNTRAVGNMNVNAVGDTVDSNNQVISDSTSRVNQVYGRTTQNPRASQVRSVRSVRPVADTKPAPQPTPTPTPPSQPIPPAFTNQPEPEPRVRPVAQPAPAPEPEVTEEELNEFDEFDAEEPVGKPPVIAEEPIGKPAKKK